MTRILQTCIALSAALLLSGCAPAADDGNPYQDVSVQDPVEPLNRVFYKFNSVVDHIMLRPVTSVYRGVVPEFGRDRVHSFLDNLSSPVTFANSLLQGDADNAFVTFWRFVLNTTLGFGGLYDFAADAGLHKKRDEDFGQTLGVWGADSGPYLMLPLIGPSSLRDAPGRVADWLMDPFSHALSDGELAARAVAGAVDFREANFDTIDDIYNSSLDPYASFRSLYLQRRKAEVENYGSEYDNEGTED